MTQNQTVQISDSRRTEFNQILDVLQNKSETLPQLCRSGESRA